jgi:hypothetical protein
MNRLLPIGLVLAIASPILSAVWVVSSVREQVVELRRDVDRHEDYFTELRRAQRTGEVKL